MYPSRDFPARARMSYRLVDEASRGRARRAPMAVEVAAARRLFTREEYHRMGEAGILKPTDRVELIRGEIVEMSPIGRRHYAFVNNLNQLLNLRLAGRAIVAVQGPIALADDTEPEPDVAIIRRPPGALQGARGLRGGRAPADRGRRKLPGLRPIDQAQALRRGRDSGVLGGR